MIVTLMTIDGQGQGNFVNWLKKLGLSDDFLRAYPVAQLVDWGWLRPQFRMVFPGAFFTPPETLTWPPQSPQASTTLEEIWLQEWRFVNEQEPMWFLHPFFRPNSQTHQLLAQNSHACGLPAKPATVQLQDEGVIKPFQDYYFPWQGFALIDVIEAADVFAQAKNLLVTPDVEKRAQSLLNSAKTTSLNPEKVLDAQLGWAVWAEPMTWLAHYTALTEFVGSHENQHGHCPGLRERSAKQLADHLQIGVPQLEAAVKEKLLVLAQR